MFFDAVGLGFFTAMGCEKAASYGIIPVGIVFSGCLSAVGGGVLRDIFAKVLNDFISLAKTHYDRKGNEYLLEQLEIALDKTNNNVQDAVNEARTTYQNVNTICLVNHLHLEKDEEALLEKIKEISMSKGWLGGLNSWNTTNTWPGR